MFKSNDMSFNDIAFSQGRGYAYKWPSARMPLKYETNNTTASMYRNNPLQNTIDLNDRVSPFAMARLYATDDARQLNNLVAHGLDSRLIPRMTTTNLYELEDYKRSGIAGEVSMNYNYNMFDPQRDNG